MENLSHALYMAFALFVFVIAFSYSLYMVHSLNNTAEVLVYRLDKTNYYDTLQLDYLLNKKNDLGETKQYSKTVGIEAIIPTLYRYYTESFAVKIEDEKGNLMQVFDSNAEQDVMIATELKEKLTDRQKALLDLYGPEKGVGKANPINLYGGCWAGKTDLTRERIDMYITGKAGYLNNTYVDYSQNFEGLNISAEAGGTVSGKIYLNNFKNRKFKEIFTQYSYEGDTITTEDDELISLTGTHQIATKIIIIYQLLPFEE